MLVLAWGSTFGPVKAACRRLRNKGKSIAHAHMRHLNPFPSNLGDVLRSYDRVLVPEMNAGQLAWALRAKYLIDAESFAKVQGQPIMADEIEQAILERMEA